MGEEAPLDSVPAASESDEEAIAIVAHVPLAGPTSGSSMVAGAAGAMASVVGGPMAVGSPSVLPPGAADANSGSHHSSVGITTTAASPSAGEKAAAPTAASATTTATRHDT